VSTDPNSARRSPPNDPGENLEVAPPAAVIDKVTDPRIERFKELARTVGPWIGYTGFFFTAFVLFSYWTFPWDRVRDKVIADFDRAQVPAPGAARQILSIGKLEPSWGTGIVLKEVALTTVPADPTKPSTAMRADEIRARVSLGSLLSAAKDVTFSVRTMGGTIEGSVTHKAAVQKDPKAVPLKGGARFDRTIHVDVENLALNEFAPFRDAIGVPIGGTVKGTIELTLGESRADKANGTIDFTVENYWVSDGVVPFKVPALKPIFGSENITLPKIEIGTLPIQVAVKDGIARITKWAATGKDLDVALEGQIVLKDQVALSELQLGLKFKFNESYKKKGDATAGLLFLLDGEPKLKASKRPDGFYALRVQGPLGGSPQILPGGGPGGAMQPMGASPFLKPMGASPPGPGGI
jgi:type II secretion system protein N